MDEDDDRAPDAADDDPDDSADDVDEDGGHFCTAEEEAFCTYCQQQRLRAVLGRQSRNPRWDI